MIKSTVHKFGKWYCQKMNIKEYHSQQFRRINERPIEFSFVFDCLKKIIPTSILDVGTGTTALPHTMRNCGFKVTAIDNISDYWPDGMFNRHFHVIDDDITDTKIKDNFDAVTCISVLEHIEKFDDAVANMLSLLNPGGHLILTCPYKETEYQKNVYKMEGASYGQNLPFICQMYSRKELDGWLEANNAELVEQQFWQFWDGPYWTFGNQLPIPKQVSKDELHQHSCMLIRKK
ncbi:MAG: class I SAM-dependent methyltransferase [Calditrichaeota bacterium]|nr:MAG: class I SAM-dependent methyltransferase [Calditrichota bacterium]